MADFAQRLIQARRALNLTQHELARRSGVGRGAISQIERGAVDVPKADTASRLAAALGVTDRWLLLGEEAPPKSKLLLDTSLIHDAETRAQLEKLVLALGRGEISPARFRATILLLLPE